MLTDRGTEYCGNPEHHEYELYLALEDINHSRTETKSPQTNGIVVSPMAANLAIAICGGYLVFWAAFKIPALSLSRFGNKTDLSFGIYLYAWPIQMIIAYSLHRSINPWLLSCVALVGAAIAAYFSWTAVEKPALAFAKRQAMPLAVPAG